MLYCRSSVSSHDLGLLRFDPYQNRAYNRAYNRAVKYRLGVRVRIKPQQAYSHRKCTLEVR